MANIVHRKGEPVGRGLGSPPTDDSLIRGLGSPPNLHVTHPYGVVKQHYHMEEVLHGGKCAPSNPVSTSFSCGRVSPQHGGTRGCTFSAGPDITQAPAPIHQEAVRSPAPTSTRCSNYNFNSPTSTPSPEPSGVAYGGQDLPMSREGSPRCTNSVSSNSHTPVPPTSSFLPGNDEEASFITCVSPCTTPGLDGDKIDKAITILQMSVTSLSENIIGWLMSDHHMVYLIQEHRLMGKPYTRAIRRLRSKFHVVTALARIKVSSSQAGTMVSSRSTYN